MNSSPVSADYIPSVLIFAVRTTLNERDHGSRGECDRDAAATRSEGLDVFEGL